MAATTLTMSSLNNLPRPRISSPLASSPLAGHSSTSAPFSARPLPTRTSAFPSSRPLRPFASIAHITAPQSANSLNSNPVKLIQPPANQRGQFVLNLTQAELSRQD